MYKVMIISTWPSGSSGFLTKAILNSNSTEFEIQLVNKYGAETNNTFILNSGKEKLIQKLNRKILLPYIFGDGFANSFETKKLIKILKKQNPNLIHVNQFIGNFINIRKIIRYAIKHKIKIILTCHQLDIITGCCPNPDIQNCNKNITCKCKKCRYLNQFPLQKINLAKKVLSKKIKIFSDLNVNIVAVSNYVAKEIQNFPPYSKNNISVIQNGIDCEIFQIRRFSDQTLKIYKGITDKKYIICVAESWTKRKGYFDILEIASKLISQNIKIVLVGQKPKNECSLTNVVFLGHISNKYILAELYSNAICLLNPTHSESFGLVNAEALASGTPVLTYDIGGCSEIVNSSTGILVPNMDVNQLYESLLNLINLKIKFSPTVCRKRALNLFDIKKNVKDYLNLYKKIIKSS